MDDFFSTLASLTRPQDRTSIVEWAAKWVKPPNSARSTEGFDPTITPWLIEPINAHADASIRELVLLAPTGAGKTVLLDCTIPYEIVEEPGSILLAVQGNNDATQHVQSRLMPTLRRIPQIAHIMAGMDRHKIKKDSVIFPHMDLWMGGVNMTNAQRKSVPRVKIDEAHEARPHGIIEEFRARTHDRPLSLVTIVSQGGAEKLTTDDGDVTTELHAAWKRTDQRLYHFRCPECGEVQRFRLKALRFASEDRDDGTLDEAAIRQSAHYVCLGRCETKFEDIPTSRYALSAAGVYVPTNPQADTRYRGYQCNALALHYVPWSDTALRYALAVRAKKQGDPTALRIFRQKRMAENHREDEDVQQTALPRGDYTLADYAAGQLWPGEAVRFATIDRQRDHWWIVIRAWKADGTSRRLYVGRINTQAALEAVVKQYNVAPENVGEDCSYEPDDVYNDSGRNGWFSMRGEDALYFPFPKQGGRRKYYSPVREVRGTSGKPANLLMWATLPIKRILERMRGGYRPGWEVEKDITPIHERHLFSEIEKDVISKVHKRLNRIFVRRHKDNHTWDCEAMQVVLALIRGMLADLPDQHAAEPAAPE